MIKKITKLAFIFVAVITAFSCKNFMNGGDFLTELEESVWNASHERSVATIFSPKIMASGDYRNTSIIISFTKEMNTETLAEGFSVIDKAGNSLAEYYEAPVWNEDKTQVIIAANERNLLPISTGGFMDIIINLTSALKDSSNTSISNPVSQTYTLNSQFD